MVRWGIVIDLDRCSACQACVVACRAENNVPVSSVEEVRKERAIFWNQFFSEVHGTYPYVHLTMFPRPCMHCEDPPCVPVCPVEATYKDEEGRVVVRYDKCIGCRYCMVACPYGARYFNWFTPEYAEGHRNYLNPDSARDAEGWVIGPSPRPRGVVEKCTLCVQRVMRAKQEGTPVGSEHAGGTVSACAQTCPASAISFGDLEDPGSNVYRLSRDRRAFRLLEDLGTRPQVYYLAEG